MTTAVAALAVGNVTVMASRDKREKEAFQGYKVSLGFLGCKDPRDHMDHQDKRVILENLDFLAQKGQEDPLE